MDMKEDIIYGLNPAMEALRGTRKAFELFIAGTGTDKRLEKLLKLAAEKGSSGQTPGKSRYHKTLRKRPSPGGCPQDRRLFLCGD